MVWNHSTSGSGSQTPAIRTMIMWSASGKVLAETDSFSPHRRTESQRLEPQDQGSEGYDDTKDEGKRQERVASEGGCHQQELAQENAERRQPRDGEHADHQAPADRGMAGGQAPDLRYLLRSLDLSRQPDRDEDRRLGQAVHRHMQQAREIGDGTAHAEGKGDDPHMLDRA